MKFWKYIDKKENKIFLIYKEIQNGPVAKSYMTNGLLIYGKYLRISSTLNFLIYEENKIFFFIRVGYVFLKKQSTGNVWSGPLTNKATDTRHLSEESIGRRKHRRGEYLWCWYRWQICRLTCEYFLDFKINLKWPFCYFQGLAGRWFMKKIWSKISRNTIPLLCA